MDLAPALHLRVHVLSDLSTDENGNLGELVRKRKRTLSFPWPHQLIAERMNRINQSPEFVEGMMILDFSSSEK
jgi:hypothetical protein